MARWRPVLLDAALALVVLIAFAPAFGAGFVQYDDQVYVTDNPHVLAGLSAPGIRWAGSAILAGNYHPLTLLSLMFDATFWHADPAAYHVHNVLLHALAAVLIFEALRRATGQDWLSLFAAALWALHPLRVESVAWISERKDVLSGALGAAMLLAYVLYAQRPSAGRYGLVNCLFISALLAKSVVVTLPFVLLLLDWWPLKRPRRWKHLVLEKLPMMGISAAFCIVTIWAQHHDETISELARVSMPMRLGNAVVSYVRYLGKTIFPRDLVYLYPLPDHLHAGWVIASALLLLLITCAVFAWRRRWPFLIVGWLWFVGMLVPMIGIVQVGRQSMADRYTYWPSVGLCIIASWGGHELARRLGIGRRSMASASCVIAVLLGGLTAHQIQTWHDSEALFGHAIAVDPTNVSAWRALGNARFAAEDWPGAAHAYERALELDATSVSARTRLAIAFTHLNELNQAIAQYRAVLSMDRSNELARTNLTNLYNASGAVAAARGDLESAGADFRAALEINPRSPEAHNNLGRVLMLKKDRAGAREQFEAALHLNPDLVSARRNLQELLHSTTAPAATRP
jgi:Flp pilus assembly protein TadD